MSDDSEIPGQQSFDIIEEAPLTVALSRSRRRAVIAGATAVVTGVAFAGWGVSEAMASSPGTAGFPRVASLAAGSSINASSVAASLDSAIVDITATDGYSGDEDEGTGMVLTSGGEVLTNNHVVNGATSIAVTLPSTGKTYRARVVGTDASKDVALLKLVSATGLSTITVGDATSAKTGIAVAAAGNALGKGGTPAVTSGTITGTGRSITASDGDGSSGERLTGLLETNADIVSGDSGGPLIDSSGQVIGMDTAAEESGSGVEGFEDSAITSSSDGYAIPITTALSIARQIAAGKASSTIVIGTPGFLGVEVASGDTSGSGGSSGFGGYGGYGGSAVSGATVAGVVSGSPAADAGITAGDTITAVNGTTVTSAQTLMSRLDETSGGDRVTLTWADVSGASHHGTITLVAGPAA